MSLRSLKDNINYYTLLKILLFAIIGISVFYVLFLVHSEDVDGGAVAVIKMSPSVPQSPRLEYNSPRYLRPIAMSIPETCGDDDMGPKCADCRTQLVCVNNYTMLTAPCAQLDPLKPYCIKNACTSQPPSTEDACPINILRCTGIGHFPDPYNCSRSYICAGTDMKPQISECPSEYIYESKSGLCKRGSCKPTDCAKTPNQFIIPADDPSIMINCLGDTSGTEAFVFRCPNWDHMQYNKDTLKCEFHCTSEETFVDQLDCHKYFECYRSWPGDDKSFIFSHRECPDDFSFDPVRLVCDVYNSDCVNGMTTYLNNLIDEWIRLEGAKYDANITKEMLQNIMFTNSTQPST